jgi:hypothetical protein
MPDPPQEASDNLRQIEIPYIRKYTPRYIKRTGRVVQFATRVTPEFDKQIREITEKKNVYLAEILEEMLNAYLNNEKSYNSSRERERERERAKIQETVAQIKNNLFLGKKDSEK